MIYGAYGFTGRRLARRAVDRGLDPVLAGRSEEKLKPLAADLDLEYRVASLEAAGELNRVLEDVGTVVHVAGPFVRTAEPMLEACVGTGTNYLDITGEIPVFEKHFEYDTRARQSDCAIVGGMGFDVVPTDCLARYVALQVESPETLDIVVKAEFTPSSGTMKTMLELAPDGGYRRRSNQLEPASIADSRISVQFPGGSFTAVSIPLGDLVTAWHSTGAPNVSTYVTVPGSLAPFVGPVSSVVGSLFRIKPLRTAFQHLADWTVSGPDEHGRETSENWIYARATGNIGQTAEAWLRTPEAYEFTVRSCLAAIRDLPGLDLAGSYAPSEAFGEDFALEIEGTRRYDELP